MATTISIPTNKLTLTTGETIYLLADNNKWLSRINGGGGPNAIEAAKSSPDQSCAFYVNVNEDKTISLKADNKMWVSRISKDGTQPLEAAKKEIDQYSKFTIMQLCNAQDITYIALQADTGKWCSRIYRNDRQPIDAVKAGIDINCMFTVHRFT